MSQVINKFEKRSSLPSISSLWICYVASDKAKFLSTPPQGDLNDNKRAIFSRSSIANQDNNEVSSCMCNPQRFILTLGLFTLLFWSLLKIPAIFFVIDSDWYEGFHHPLAGWDHLLAMVAVGIWAAQLRRQAVWLLPLVFVSIMSLGGMVGAASFVVPNAEIIILLSGLILNVFIIRKIRFSTPLNMLIIAFFAFFHGYAHGEEISASASLASYTAGFVFATLLLHSAGILIARLTEMV